MKAKLLTKTILYALLAVFMIWTVGPYLWTIISSISLPIELTAKPPHWIPRQPTLENYKKLLQLVGEYRVATATRSSLRQNLLYSFFISCVTTALCILFGSLSAYSFSRHPFRGSSFLFFLIFGSQLLPFIVLAIPLYITLARLRLLDKLGTLIFLYISFTLPFVIWLMKNYFEMIPKDIEDAAMIDGCTPIRALVRVVLPVCAPGLVATGIFSFLGAWNEFFLALIFMSRTQTITLSVATLVFGWTHRSDLPLVATGAVIASLPPVLLALLFQKFIIRGLMQGAVKG
ncbi:MAG: carbohydrate ABC transporter permease [Spirochaetia bacterium]